MKHLIMIMVLMLAVTSDFAWAQTPAANDPHHPAQTAAPAQPTPPPAMQGMMGGMPMMNMGMMRMMGMMGPGAGWLASTGSKDGSLSYAPSSRSPTPR